MNKVCPVCKKEIEEENATPSEFELGVFHYLCECGWFTSLGLDDIDETKEEKGEKEC